VSPFDPNEAAIKTIVGHEPILEVSAGAGYWAWCIRQFDADIIATDPAAPIQPQWSPVWTASAQKVVPDYPERTLLLVWPSYDDIWPAEALEMYQGETIIYVGEGRGGCTADDRFHQMLHEEWELVETVDIPQYLGLHDRLEVWHS